MPNSLVRGNAEYKDRRILEGLCDVDANGTARIAIVNTSSEPMVIKKWQRIGEWESAYRDDMHFKDAPTDMLCNQGKPMSEKERLDKLFSLVVGNRDGRTPSPELRDIITEKNQVFAVEDSELTQTTPVAHDIDTRDTKPIRQKTRPVPALVPATNLKKF
ncbi:unnamed protein product [Haemonchus placei]|uniref:MSP domain-containing protein n=1 Tax=Haemonchus placei TaxID=6290 RepID=A0A0N4X918_HAEPC|nr:unnamed protein product [Haemonchus placei]